MDRYLDYKPGLFRSWIEFTLFVLLIAGAAISLIVAPGASAQEDARPPVTALSVPAS